MSGPSDLGDDFDSGDETLVCHFGPLFEQLLVFLAVILVDFREFPSENVLLAFRFICPAVPFVGTIMEDADDLVEEYGALFLEDFSDLGIVLKLDHHEDDVESMTWDHDFKGAISRGYVVSYNQCP